MRYLTKKTIRIVVLLIILLLAWAPWLDNQSILNKVLKEKGWKNWTITTPERFVNLSDEHLQELLEESRKKGVENGIVVCDYKVQYSQVIRH